VRSSRICQIVNEKKEIISSFEADKKGVGQLERKRKEKKKGQRRAEQGRTIPEILSSA